MRILFTIMVFCVCSNLFGNNKNLDTITVSTFELVDLKIPKQYKTTTFDSISMVESRSLSELIQQHSSVFIKDYGPSSLSSISFRGTGASHTQVQWNGILLNSPMNGQIDFSLYPTVFFNTAELHHGAATLMDRNGALGGNVLLSNSRNFGTKNSALIKQSIGSYDSYTTEFSSTFNQKNWLLETQLFYSSSQNDFVFKNISKKGVPEERQKNAEILQYGIQQSVYRKIKNGSFGGRIWLFDSNRNLAPSITKDSASENQKDQSFRALLEFNQLKNNWSFNVTSGIVKDLLIYEDISTKIYSKSNSYSFDNTINTNFYLNNKINIINNINIHLETAESNGYASRKQQTNGSWMVGAIFHFNRLDINLNNRFIALKDILNPIVPSIGAKLQVLNKEQLYIKANAGINYHYPTLNDLFWNPGGNINLKPEKAKMTDVGLSYSKTIKNNEITVDVTGFYNYVSNWIIWLPTEFNYWSPSNLKEVENKGIEATFSLSSTMNKLNIKHNANYAYTASTNMKTNNEKDISINKQLIYVPFHKFNYTLSASFKNTSIYYNYSYTGLRYISTDNNWYMPDYFIHNASIRQKIKLKKINLTASFKANNVLNQDYQSIAYRAMPSRNFLFSISIAL